MGCFTTTFTLNQNSSDRFFLKTGERLEPFFLLLYVSLQKCPLNSCLKDSIDIEITPTTWMPIGEIPLPVLVTTKEIRVNLPVGTQPEFSNTPQSIQNSKEKFEVGDYFFHHVASGLNYMHHGRRRQCCLYLASYICLQLYTWLE